MKFLFPGFLWALFLVLIPIIIHLFNFRRYKTVYFSNVQFLQSIKKETKSKSQLRNIIILLTRMLLVVMLVLVFARPYIPSYEGQEKQGNTIVSIYIDNSFSMESMGQEGELLESAKVKAMELCNGFEPNTQFKLLTNNLSVEHQRFANREQMNDWISNIKSSHIVRSLHEIVAYAEESMAEYDTLNTKYLFLLSDFQKSTTTFPSDFNPSQEIRFVVVPLKSIQQSNLSIDSAWFRTPGHYIGKTEDLIVRVRNSSGSDLNEIPLELFINDTLKTKANVTVKAHEVSDVKLSYIQRNAGRNIASLSISDYPITFDNSLYFNYHIKKKINVLLVNASGNYNYPEKLYKQDENFNTITSTDKNIPYDQLSQYSFLVLSGIEKFSTGMIQSVTNFVQQGGTLVVIPSKQSNVDSYNKLSTALNIVKWNNWLEQKGNVAKLNYSHRVFENTFKKADKNMSLPSYTGFFDFQINTRSTFFKLYESESLKPLFIEQKIGKGMVFLSALPFDSEYTNLMVHPLFVPLMYNTALQSVQLGDLYQTITSNVQVAFHDNYAGIEMLEMQHLENKAIIYPEYRLNENILRVFPTADDLEAGTYKVNLNEKDFRYISFNYDREESDIAAFEEDELTSLFSNVGVKLINRIKADSNISKGVEQLNRGRELSQLFLLIALLLLLTEALLIRFLK